MRRINTDYNDLNDRDLMEELNRKHSGNDDLLPEPVWKRTGIAISRLVALILVLVFLFTTTVRWLSVFTGPSFQFLRESWTLSGDPLVCEVRRAVVQVYVENRVGLARGSLRGSGFNLDPGGLIITNRHLVEDAVLVRVSFPQHGTLTVTEWIVSPVTDLAVLKLDGEDLPVVNLADTAVQPDDEVLVIGNPLKFARIANRGRVAGYQQASNRELPYLLIEAMIYPGSSGSPVFNDRGEVVAIVFATMHSDKPEEVRGLAIDVRELIILLESMVAD